ncbi:MAG: hypothetical protein U9R72_01675 [Chloroflexota bacterium]|nr:hypothetical protein [Chloroflexota bacterium]
MLSKKWFAALLSVVMVAGLAVTACQPEEIVTTVEVTVPPEQIEVTVPPEQVEVTVPPEEVEVTPEPERVDRKGAWVDTVIMSEEPSSDAAVTRLETGDIDVYAFSIAEAPLAERIRASEEIESATSYGSYNELTFNTVGPEFEDGRLNPFSVPRIRFLRRPAPRRRACPIIFRRLRNGHPER